MSWEYVSIEVLNYFERGWILDISKCRQIDRQQNNCSSFVAKARLLGVDGRSNVCVDLTQFRIITWAIHRVHVQTSTNRRRYINARIYEAFLTPKWVPYRERSSYKHRLWARSIRPKIPVLISEIFVCRIERYFPPGRTDLVLFPLEHISHQESLDKMLKDLDESGCLKCRIKRLHA